jgi:AraC-like DNA-binding protein
MPTFQRIEPAKPLQHLIQGYWQIETGKEPEFLDLVPDGFPEIAILLQGKVSMQSFGSENVEMPKAGVIGQLTTRFHSHLHPYTKILFIKMYPWTPKLLFKHPIYLLNNNVIELELLTADKLFRQLIIDIGNLNQLQKAALLLDAYFLKKLAIIKLDSPFLIFSIQQIFQSNGMTSIDSLRQNIHASRRYVEKLFKNSIGVTPKQYARLIRVKKASIIMLQESFCGQVSTVAAELEYYDQSHFLKDFKSVVGMTPTQFLQHQFETTIIGKEQYLGQWDYS